MVKVTVFAYLQRFGGADCHTFHFEVVDYEKPEPASQPGGLSSSLRKTPEDIAVHFGRKGQKVRLSIIWVHFHHNVDNLVVKLKASLRSYKVRTFK